MVLATSAALWMPYPGIASTRPPQLRRLSSPSQHVQHVGEVDVRSVQAKVIADLLGELQGLMKVGQAFVAAAKVGVVGAR